MRYIFKCLHYLFEPKYVCIFCPAITSVSQWTLIPRHVYHFKNFAKWKMKQIKCSKWNATKYVMKKIFLCKNAFVENIVFFPIFFILPYFDITSSSSFTFFKRNASTLYHASYLGLAVGTCLVPAEGNGFKLHAYVNTNKTPTMSTTMMSCETERTSFHAYSP